jgi:hypothetical protein
VILGDLPEVSDERAQAGMRRTARREADPDLLRLREGWLRAVLVRQLTRGEIDRVASSITIEGARYPEHLERRVGL